MNDQSAGAAQPSGWPRAEVGDPEGMQWLQDRVRDLLVDLQRVASAHGLRYYLAYGTAIGALRSGDLIPWDPDADVLVPQDDYDELLAALRTDLSPEFEVVAPGDGDYENLFARLAVRGIDHKIIRVDLFPLCTAPRGRRRRAAFTAYQRLLAKAYLIKNVDLGLKSHYSASKMLVARLLRAMLVVWPARSILRAFERLVRGREIDGATGDLTNPSGAYGGREYFDAAWFASTTTARIGDVDHPVPQGIDPMLTMIYGDYMTPVSDADIADALVFAAEHYVRPLRAAGHISP